MSDPRESGITRNPDTRSEYPPSRTTHTSSYLAEKVGYVTGLLKGFAHGLVLGWTRIGVSPEEIGVTDEAVEELHERIEILLGRVTDIDDTHLNIDLDNHFVISRTSRARKIGTSDPDASEPM